MPKDGYATAEGAPHSDESRHDDADQKAGRDDPGARTVSVAFVEDNAKHTDVESYAGRSGERLPFDYVWFTPAVDDEDPREKFKKSLERLRGSDNRDSRRRAP